MSSCSICGWRNVPAPQQYAPVPKSQKEAHLMVLVGQWWIDNHEGPEAPKPRDIIDDLRDARDAYTAADKPSERVHTARWYRQVLRDLAKEIGYVMVRQEERKPND